ncbi:MAG: histidinol-phosphatase HisJ family protein [Velocimicrobium sp.]
MIRTDCHAHSCFSSDCSTPVELMIEQAILFSFDTFYLTDHMDFDFPDTEEGLDFLFSPSDYFKTLSGLKKKYEDTIKIMVGIELGLKTTASVKKQIGKLLNEYSFDLIIGSTHLVDNLDPYHSSYWEGRSEKEGLAHFFRATLENTKAYPNVNVLGHLDYAIRYSPSKGINFSFEAYQSILEEILTFIIANDIALEVNTAGFKHGLNKPNPNPDIIKRYLDLGGSMISIGSDGHVPSYYGYRFEETRTLLLDLGVTHYTTFEKGVARKFLL